ncbi:MAG TPA: thioredoxin domain-containing protein, partial [Solirubrobacterales bacterium]|nr:thioredoxin domain-containing protein [Solirubrobacterales bacterium]
MASEVAVKPLPRRGRIWVLVLLALGLIALGYTIVEISTQKAGDPVVHLDGVEDAQGLFGGMPQEGDRLGSDDAPVTIQVFNDLQCDDCRDDFLSTIPQLAERYARPGDVKLLWRHYSNSINPEQLGFYGAEAAADQGYGWPYIYLFFRNQDEAERFGIDDDYLASIAAGVEELDVEEWEADLEEN